MWGGGRTPKVRGWKEDEVEGVEGHGRSEDGRTLKVRWTGLLLIVQRDKT